MLKLKINCLPKHNIYNIIYNNIYNVKAFGKLEAIKYTWMIFTCLHKKMNHACTSLQAVSPRKERSFFTLLHSLLFNSDLLLGKHMLSVLKLVKSTSEVKGLLG